MKLEGVRVLDLSAFLPGPHLTMTLADHGADVVMVEPANGVGEPTRAVGYRDSDDVSVWFRNIARGKRSLRIDLKDPDGRRLFHHLAEGTDVVVESFRPGVAARLGVDYATLAAANPRLVYCSISAFGQDGPLRDKPAHDLTVQALAGVAALNRGLEDGKPAAPNMPAADAIASLTSLSAILMALFRRARTGRGEYIDIAMYDALLAWTPNVTGPVFAHDAHPEPARMRSFGGSAMYRIYETSDGEFLVLGGSEVKFARNLLAAFDRLDLVPFAEKEPGPDQEPLRAFFRERFRARPRAHWERFLEPVDCCWAFVRSLKDAFDDPHTLRREMLLRDAGGHRHIGVPIKFAEEPARPCLDVPDYGEHSVEIGESVGFDPADLATLRARGAIRCGSEGGWRADARMTGDLLDRLAALASATTFEELPAPAVLATQTFLLDTLAVGVAGRTGPWRDETLRTALSWGAGGACRILGDGLAAPPATAAFLNAYQMHCLEFDCVHEGAVAHVMTAVAAAAVAESERAPGERDPVDGRRLVLALAVGVEVATALGVAANAPLRFFRPATVGVFGAAVAVGVLRGFGGTAIRRCFGHALGQVAGTMQAHEEGKPTLPLQLGAAARAGIVAADLAGAGVPAPDHALEGRLGYFALFESRFDTTGIARTVGRAWRVTELSHKPYPSGRATHGGIDGVLQLRRHGVHPDNLVEMTLAAPPLIHQLVIRPPRMGMDANYARLCFAYTGAVALQCGRVGIEHFTEAELRGPQRLALAERFAATVNESANPAAFVPQTLTARMRDGTSRSVRIDELPGAPGRPLSREEREAKVRSCVAAVYGDDGRARRLIETVRALLELPDARVLLDPVTDPAEATP